MRPALRGVSHGIAVAGSIIAALVLWKAGGPDRAKQISLLVFGLSLFALYTASATYHMGEWKGRLYQMLRRLDHAMIFVLIAGTSTPFCFIALKTLPSFSRLSSMWMS